MKAKKTSATKPARTLYSAEFKEQALLRAEKDGVAQAAKDLNLKPSQLYAWRQRQQLTTLTTEDQRLQQAEIARLKREVARLQDEADFLKKRQRTSRRNPREVRDDQASRA